MKKEIMLVYSGLALFYPSLGMPFDQVDHCLQCNVGMICDGRVDSNRCCFGKCVTVPCGGIIACEIGDKLNPYTCECEKTGCDPGEYLDGLCKVCPAQFGCLVDSTGLGGIETCRVTGCILSNTSGTYTYTTDCYYSDKTIPEIGELSTDF